MNHRDLEPPSSALNERPCSTPVLSTVEGPVLSKVEGPHSGPVAWLGACPERVETQSTEGQRAAPPAENAPPGTTHRESIIAAVLADPELLAEIIARAPPSAFPLPAGATRHAGTERSRSDGWTGERMARFLEVLADTGLVTEASRAAGMHRDSAYDLRNRDPIFAAAMRAAKAKARPRVSDGLLERSITGTVEHYYRDGVLVGERRHYESWLGLAVLKRLDKQVDDDRAEDGLPARIARNWQAALDALRSGGTGAVPALLAPEPDKPDTPPPPASDPWENCWRAGSAEDPKPGRAHPLPQGAWMTTFAPPPSFDGYENGPWDGYAWYERACTAEEAELIEAHDAATEAAEQAELTAYAEAERDGFFAKLRAELAAAELGSAAIGTTEDNRDNAG